MRTRAFLLALASTLYMLSSAQNYITPVNGNLVPPTPQSWAPVERQIPKPSLATGTLNLGIPVYTVTVGDYSLPISLSYSGGGVKVMDDPCPLGYGWTLLPALRATRTMMGRPDEMFPFQSRNSAGDDLDFAYKSMVNPSVDSTIKSELIDSEHDIFTFALPDGNLSRVLDMSSGTPVFYGDRMNDYRVTADKDLNYIYVIDSRGIKYTFGGCYELQEFKCSPGTILSSWALSRIDLPSGDAINFTWTADSHPNTNHGWLGGYTFMDRRSMGNGEVQPEDIDDAETASFKYFGKCRGYLTLRRISVSPSHTASDCSVEFLYSSYANYGPMLSQISVRNSENKVVKTAAFSYKPQIPLLTSVNLSDEGKYSMDYDQIVDFYNSYAQDWWGFYNGKTDNPSLTPKIWIKRYDNIYTSVGSFELIEGVNGSSTADRSVDTEAMKANSLTKITYPTGGYSEFEYEAHSFNYTPDSHILDEVRADNPPFTTGGGLRVKKIKMHSGIAGKSPQTISYTYPDANVRAVPSPDTFLDIRDAVTSYTLYGDLAYFRIVSISLVSNYMSCDIGEVPVWYPYVTETYAEGEKVYYFNNDIAPHNERIKIYGKNRHKTLNRIFSKGPQLVETKTYRVTGSNKRLVEREVWNYSPPMNSRILSSTLVDRAKIQVGTGSRFCPDFDDGYKISTSKFRDKQIENIYELTGYSINAYYERLLAHTKVVYADNGQEISTHEDFEYAGDSERVAKRTSTDSRGRTETVTIEYPGAGVTPHIEGQMRSAGAVGFPVRETVQRGGATTVYSMEYDRTGSGAFVPVQLRTRFGSATAPELKGPRFSYSPWGRLTGFTDADGLSETWLWGHFGRYPVWHIPDESYSGVRARTGGKAETQRADTLDLFPSFPLASKYVYSPLVGLTQTVVPSGTTADYAYDSANRLVSVRRNGTEIQTVSYRIGQDADNRVTVSDVIRGNSKHVRLSQFDGLGRLIKTNDSSTGVSVSRKYDAMGRLYGESAPGRDAAQDSNWTVNAYEPSPRGRLTSTTKPGKAWHDGNKRVLSRMVANTSSGALSLSCYVASGNAVVRNGLYSAGALTVEETVDEDGHYSRKFTDRHGLTVGTAEGVPGQMLTTHYVYDDYDRLLYILPPGMTNSTYSSSSLAEQAYSYKYDAFGRMVESRVPGCAPAKFRYSRAGRLVAEHPAAMADGKWLLHFYDRAGREVLSSVASPTEAQIQSLCDTLRTAYYFGYNLYGGYKFSSDLPCDIGQIQKATYYDGYSFVTRTDADFGFDASACPFNKATTLARGLVAGETDYSQGLDPAPGTVYVYDADGRVVRQYAMLRRGRHAVVRTFDTAGNVLTEDETLCNGTTPHISRHTDNTYDSAGRLISTDISENGKSASVKRFYGQNGLLSKEKFGNGVDRTYRYDVHGWPTSNTIGLAPLTLPAIPAGTLSATYYNSLDGGLQGDRDFDDLLVRDRYTETLLYADGIYPRYSGCPSAKKTSLGGRYDYRFDGHDRLTKADYTAPDSEDEDFSAEYTYDDLGNPLTLKRYGIIDYTSGGEATYGLVDDLTFSYPSGSSQLESVASASEGTDFYGRVGFPLSGSQYTWNAAGLMTSDSGFGITAITYNDFGLPVKFHTQNKKNYTAYSYSADGALLQKEVSTSTSSPFPFTSKSETTYSAGRIFYSGTRSNPLGTYVSYFPGGYFDSNGGVHYMHLDYQGSVVMETDSAGHIEKHRGYYPYGEPWAESTNKKTLAASVAQPQTYQSKERTAATGDYDFGPRRYISAAPFWGAPDPKAHDYPNISPYAFCAANPVRYADPTGCKIEGVRKEDAANAVQDLRAMFVGDEFAAFRELIVQSGKKQNGKSLAPISQEALAKALDGANLNADQQALVEMTVNTINSDDKHVVEYRELSEKISSEGEMLLRPTLDADYLAYFAQFDSDGLRMQTVYNVRGDGATIGKQRGSYSIINANAQYRPAISAHEIIGHGRALSLGRYDTQLEDAITTENLVYRTMGIPYINNGSSHQGSNGKPLKKCSSLPGFR